MRKIRLNVEKLHVESFTTADEAHRRGTVVGHATQVGGGCVYPTAVYHSCEPGVTYGEYSCYCLYPNTDVRICCTVQGCSGGGMC